MPAFFSIIPQKTQFLEEVNLSYCRFFRRNLKTEKITILSNIYFLISLLEMTDIWRLLKDWSIDFRMALLLLSFQIKYSTSRLT